MNSYEFDKVTIEKYSTDQEALVTALTVTEFYGKMSPVPIFGTSDNKIKILKSDNTYIIYNAEEVVTEISPYKSSSYDISYDHYLFGTRLGSHGLIKLNKDTIQEVYHINKNSMKAEIVGFKSFDINLDGKNEIIIIRSNGEIDIFNEGASKTDIFHISKYESKELLTNIDIGRFRSDEELDLMLSTYSGIVFSLTPRLKGDDNYKKPLDKKQIKVKDCNKESYPRIKSSN